MEKKEFTKKQIALQSIRGMNDILPDESARWEYFEAVATRVARQYGYRNMRAPIVEPTSLFVRSIGELTDIVEKEMYSFEDKLNGEKIMQRLELNAGLVRTAIEANTAFTIL
jgi:histidyl-tRNA synthetase